MRSINETPRLNEAELFLATLDSKSDRATFQTFDDLRHRRDRRIARILHGSLNRNASMLGKLNEHGAGIFVSVNATDLRGRSVENIRRIRAVWQDDDIGWSGDFPLRPSLVVNTSPGKFQRYWFCDGLTFVEHQTVMDRISRDFGNDPNAKDLARVLRLPGFWHKKHPDAPHLVRIVGGNRRRYSAHQILTAFPPIIKQLVAPSRPCHSGSGDYKRVADALRRIPADDREVWLRVGMALRNHFGDAGRTIWEKWSSTSQKYDPRTQERVWRSFRRGGVTIATLFHYSKEYGRAA